MDSTNDVNFYQREFWAGEFGHSFIDRRNSLDKINSYYEEKTGISISQIFNNFFSRIDRHSKILELGCNIGLNLSILQKMGFFNLHGLEINKKAFEIALTNNPAITFINSSIESYEPKEEKYDVVFTAFVLQHQNPLVLDYIVQKIIRLTNKYIFGLEYYSDKLTAINYRGHSNVMWKQNFPLLFLKASKNIKMVKEEKFYYKNENLCDVGYLLMKTY